MSVRVTSVPSGLSGDTSNTFDDVSHTDLDDFLSDADSNAFVKLTVSDPQGQAADHDVLVATAQIVAVAQL